MLTSHIWHKLFLENQIPKKWVVVEVAPGYEPKIGDALALFDFSGTIFLIEPDQKAACDIQRIYKKILPQATVKIVIKALQNVEIGVDIPKKADALVASHPFDDMVISFIVKRPDFFSREKENGEKITSSAKKLYDAMNDGDYAFGIRATISVWKEFIENAKPKYFMASQYPSHTLTVKGLQKRQESGFIVLENLKCIYKDSLVAWRFAKSFNFKGDPKWWIIVKNSHKEPGLNILERPLAIKRLGESVFVPQQARRLHADEYDIVYIDNKYFKNLDSKAALQQAKEFAITLDNESRFSPETIITYADRQKDKTDIALTGNLGSGRAVYYGEMFNILGVGKTTLCKSIKPSHSTGRLEIIGAMRRIILSKWINFFTKRAPAHSLLIVLKETAMFKWNSSPVLLALLLRIDGGSLDRPSHVEENPQIPIDFEKTLSEYAKLDAEFFAYRIMLGAWSTSNYSLSGHIIDLESASFVKYRGPYYTSSSKHQENRFGCEGLGFLRILHQLAEAKNIKDKEIANKFYNERRRHLSHCFLLLLGVSDNVASGFFSRHQDRVSELSGQFEELAKKIGPRKSNLNLYMPIPEDEDPSLLDMSNLFRNLANIYESPSAEKNALKCLIRKVAPPGILGDRAQNFVHELFNLLSVLGDENCLDEKKNWGGRLRAINQNLPTMFELNSKLKILAEEYRLGRLKAEALNSEITALCDLPYRLGVLSKF